MDNPEPEHSYYHPAGVPVTPQARRLGYEFPIYVSNSAFRDTCVSLGIMSKHNTNLERRIHDLLTACYEGMVKRLSTDDDFLFYNFKLWYWVRAKPNAKKQEKIKLGARLFISPVTNAPWMYIFDPSVDTIDMLEKGQPPCETCGAPEGEVHPPACADAIEAEA